MARANGYTPPRQLEIGPLTQRGAQGESAQARRGTAANDRAAASFGETSGAMPRSGQAIARSASSQRIARSNGGA